MSLSFLLYKMEVLRNYGDKRTPGLDRSQKYDRALCTLSYHSRRLEPFSYD